MLCEKCKYWINPQKSPTTDNMVGECHRFPRVSVIPFESDESKWLYPLQFDKDSCGEYKKI